MTLRELMVKVCKEHGWSDERISRAAQYASMRSPEARVDIDMADIPPLPGKTAAEMEALITAFVLAKMEESDVMDQVRNAL